jgi:hypothetical protein
VILKVHGLEANLQHTVKFVPEGLNDGVYVLEAPALTEEAPFRTMMKVTQQRGHTLTRRAASARSRP